MGSLIKILEGPKEELIDVDVTSLPDSVLISVAPFTTISHCRRLGQWDYISMEHNTYRGLECVCTRFYRIG